MIWTLPSTQPAQSQVVPPVAHAPAAIETEADAAETVTVALVLVVIAAETVVASVAATATVAHVARS